MGPDVEHGSLQETEAEVATLEVQLAVAREKLERQRRKEPENGGQAGQNGAPKGTEVLNRSNDVTLSTQPPLPPATHYLLLLSDSALPLGSFAFSSGLESYLAHTPRGRASFSAFLPESVSSYASTTLPFVLAAWREPELLVDLDDTLDAAIICAVGRRASIAQGRALMSIWERSFAASGSVNDEARESLKPYSAFLKTASALASSTASSSTAKGSGPGSCSDAAALPPVHAHLGPLFGAVSKLVGLTLQQTAYVFMLSHVKALVSAAVRASVFGPYQAQKVLAGTAVQEFITAAIDREWNTPYYEAGQTMPVMDLWIGRHEVLYSRIFNS